MEEYTLLKTIVELYNFKSKSKSLIFEIRFNDAIRVVKIGKQWGKVSKEYQYFIHETYGPCLASNEENFIAHLASTSGIRTGLNIVDYKVYKLEG